MTYTDEQRADLAKRIEARAAKFDAGSSRRIGNVLHTIAREIRDGSFFEVHHD